MNAETKNANPATKIMSDLLNGFVQKRRVRCGKSNCKCARGEFHTAFYHIWYDDGKRYQKYIRRRDLAHTQAACIEYRLLQIQLRFGRIKYKRALAQLREMLRNLGR